MSPEEKLLVLAELQRVNQKQIANREKMIELSLELEKDITNENIRLEMKKLEIESMTLYNRDKELVSKL